MSLVLGLKKNGTIYFSSENRSSLGLRAPYVKSLD